VSKLVRLCHNAWAAHLLCHRLIIFDFSDILNKFKELHKLIHPLQVSHPGHGRKLPFLLAGLAMLGPFSIDTYMPSFPAIGASLGASSLQVQQTLSVYLGAFAVMMLFHGPLSDSFGRRPVILVSLAVFLAASVGCAFSFDIAHLLAFRAVQGLSAGAGMVVGRAMIRDLYAGHEAQRLMSRVTMIFGISPAIAPVIGGWLHAWAGWHAIFVFLALLGLALLTLSWRFLPETLPEIGRQPMSLGPMSANYRKVFCNRKFLLLSGAVAANFSGFFLYIASAPVFIVDLLGLGETQFAWLFIPAVSGIVLGAFVSGRLAGRVKPHHTVRYGYGLLFGAALANVAYNGVASPALPWSILPITLYATGMSLAMPSITLLVLDLFPHNKGMAASLQGFLQTLLNALVAGLVSPLLSFSGMALALGMMGLLALGALSWKIYLLVNVHEGEYVRT
jgi:DHA1 family bicyclomycin/chloramphenicol resistance-like MFS transporter